MKQLAFYQNLKHFFKVREEICIKQGYFFLKTEYFVFSEQFDVTFKKLIPCKVLYTKVSCPKGSFNITHQN